jgi:tetratricopeptide (TPR) repeat protein
MLAQALLGIATSAYGKTGPADLLDTAEKAGKQVEDNLDSYLSPSNKPAGVTDQQWADAKKTFELQTHSALGWIYYAKKQDPQAEAEFKKVLAVDPNQAQVSYWLGSSIIRQQKVERYSEALYSIARSLAVTGATALPPAAATAAEGYLKRAYTGYHGDLSDLDKLKAAVSSGPLPPPDFHIKSVAEIDKEKFANEEEYNKAHPDVALWRQIRTTLKSDQGDTYFPNVKETLIPTPEIGFFKAKVVAVNDKDLVINVDAEAGDGTLKFEKPINGKVINPGDPIEFKAVVESFQKEPYMLTMTVDDPKEMVKGLPADAFSAEKPTKKTTPKAPPKAGPRAAPKAPAKK